MPDPKPCPVCGGTEFEFEFEETDEGVTACLICEGCVEDVDTRGPVSKPCDDEGEAEQAAIRAWNKFGPVEGGG
jgi:Restriction alleviation protein Lar